MQKWFLLCRYSVDLNFAEKTVRAALFPAVLRIEVNCLTEQIAVAVAET